MAIFKCLFPEIWAILHGELVTPLDARDRVSLQRTCRAAHALDPGLILAPRWLEAWHRESADGHGRIPILLEFLKQLDRQRVFDWCPPTPRLDFFNWYDGDLPEDNQAVFLDWTLVPELKQTKHTREVHRITGSLTCESWNGSYRWTLELFWGDYEPLGMFEATGDSPTLEELLTNHPRLCHDISPEVLMFFALE
jgi:hypothetical protein